MSQPILTIVAGCNGSGKSTFSKSLVKDSITPFDFDKRQREIYDSLIDSEFREIMAKNMTTKEFESSMYGAFSDGKNVCYETNFNSHPLFWAEIAKKHGYYVQLHFFCINTRELAKERVNLRYRNNGHFVPDDIVYERWKEGYKNLNLHYEFFDHIVLFDNSSSATSLQALFSIRKHHEEIEVHKYLDTLPEYSERRFPDIYKLVEK